MERTIGRGGVLCRAPPPTLVGQPAGRQGFTVTQPARVEAAPAAAGRRPPSTGPMRAGRPRPSAPYPLYLVPSAVLFVRVIAVPLAMNIGISLTQWPGVGPMKWVGLANYRHLLSDSQFWASFWHSVAMIIAMAVVAAVIGLILASALFDFIGRKFGPRTASVLRACIYLPQVLPIVVAGIVWGWILDPESGALNRLLKDVGLGSLAQDWLGNPKTALLTLMAVLVWVQLGY